MSKLLRLTDKTYPQIVGHSFIPVDFDRLAQFDADVFAEHIKYVFGGKGVESQIGDGIIDFKNGIDCSGWARELIGYITHKIAGANGFPDGSYLQGQWFIRNGFYFHSIGTPQQYLDAATANDNLFRVGFHWPNGRGGDSVGHVFPIVHDHTSESYGGHGPGSRPAEHQWFVDHCDAVVVVGPLIKSADWNNPKVNPYATTTS